MEPLSDDSHLSFVVAHSSGHLWKNGGRMYNFGGCFVAMLPDVTVDINGVDRIIETCLNV